MWRGRRRWTWRGFKVKEGRKCKPRRRWRFEDRWRGRRRWRWRIYNERREEV
jgi:hypothetical protein